MHRMLSGMPEENHITQLPMDDMKTPKFGKGFLKGSLGIETFPFQKNAPFLKQKPLRRVNS